MTGLHDLVRYPTIKGLRGREGPNVIRFDLDQVQGLLVCLFISRMVCFNQEESVAGLMFDMCPFLMQVFHWSRQASNYAFLESRDQCLHGRLGLVASYRPVGGTLTSAP